MHFGRRAAEQLKFRQINVKEAFTLVGPDGYYYRAALKDWSPEGAAGLVYERMPASPESPLKLDLACAFLARQRMLFVCQKATELGVEHILPLFTEHSLSADALEHEKAHAWAGQALRAARQCRRATVPEVRPAAGLRDAVDTDVWSAADAHFFLDDYAEESAPLDRGPSRACLVVGPEGGWSDAERRLLQEAGARPLALGGRILRAETAVVAGLTVLQYALGDMGSRSNAHERPRGFADEIAEQVEA
jgi:16S rRNA (uracil1498-N3)-methyltransferase